MFQDTYNDILKKLTEKNRKDLSIVATSILNKGIESKKLNKKELELIQKIKNWIERSYFGCEYTIEEILIDCKNVLSNRQSQKTCQQFVVNPTRQSASEIAQQKCMCDNGFEIKKMSASGKNSLRFDENSSNLVWEKIEGKTSRSFDYKREYDGIIEYFTGKVTFGQGGGQNNVKNEIIDFLRRANQFLEKNKNSNYVFTVLVDGNSLTNYDLQKYKKYTSERVRLMSCDNYSPFKTL